MDTELKALKGLLAELDLTASWAARRMGVSSAYLSMILSGKSKPGEELRENIKRLRVKLKTLAAA